MVTRRSIYLMGFGVCLALTACSQAPNSTPSSSPSQDAQIATLQAEIEKLKEENEALRTTPDVLLSSISAAVRAEDEKRANAALSKLIERFPDSKEAQDGKRQVEGLVAKMQAKSAEAARLAALGLKAIKVTRSLEGSDATVTLRSASVAGQWTFDAHGDEWHYQEAEKGRKFVTAKVTISSKAKDPKLPGIAVYIEDGDTLRKIALFEYRFVRWDDYGSYLGNYADYRNDFAHSDSIPFSIGAEVQREKLNSPVYIIATKEGCFERNESRFDNPPVSYYSSSCRSLPDAIQAADFSNGRLAVLKRLN